MHSSNPSSRSSMRSEGRTMRSSRSLAQRTLSRCVCHTAPRCVAQLLLLLCGPQLKVVIWRIGIEHCMPFTSIGIVSLLT